MTDAPNDTLELETIPAPIWRNLIFLKDGRSLFGCHTFSSQDEAAAVIPLAEELMKEWLRANPAQEIVRRKDRTHLFYVREYSHAIPVPWRDKP